MTQHNIQQGQYDKYFNWVERSCQDQCPKPTSLSWLKQMQKSNMLSPVIQSQQTMKASNSHAPKNVHLSFSM